VALSTIGKSRCCARTVVTLTAGADAPAPALAAVAGPLGIAAALAPDAAAEVALGLSEQAFKSTIKTLNAPIQYVVFDVIMASFRVEFFVSTSPNLR
jgi:predicted nicotinamide N-methyase